MILGKKIKRDTMIIICSVIVLTLVTINVTYSYFFQVQPSQIPTINSEGINVTPTGTAGSNISELLPSDAYTGITSNSATVSDGAAAKSTFTITNSNTYDNAIGISLASTASDGADLGNLVVAIQKGGNWIQIGGKWYADLSKVTQNPAGYYPVISDTVSHGGSNVYTIYVWLKDGTPEGQIGKKIDLKINLKTVPAVGQDSNNAIPSPVVAD